MMFKLLLAIFSIYYVIEQTESSKKLKSIDRSDQKKAKRENQQGNFGKIKYEPTNMASPSYYAKPNNLNKAGSSYNFDLNYSNMADSSYSINSNNPNETDPPYNVDLNYSNTADSFYNVNPNNYKNMYDLSYNFNPNDSNMADPTYNFNHNNSNTASSSNTAGHPNYYSPYYYPSITEKSEQEHDEKYLRDFVNSFLQFPEDDFDDDHDDDDGDDLDDAANQKENPSEELFQELNAPDETIPPEILAKLRPGLHKYIKIEGKSEKVRKHCEMHYMNFKKTLKTTRKCETCRMMLCSECYAKQHGLVCPPTSPRPQTIPETRNCIFCGKSVLNKQISLVNHSCKNKSKEEKNVFVCCACGYKNKRRYNFEKHLRTHSGERPFSCGYCRVNYADSSNLKRHMKVHEKGLNEDKEENEK